MKFKTVLLSLFISVITFITNAQTEARLLRFPAINGNTIAFSYAGDLYTVSSNGGVAQKLTSHNGYEIFPHFSPDGNTIAFTGQYDGNTEIFTVPTKGGSPKRITTTATLERDDIADRMGPNNIVLSWSNDGENIIYRSRKQSFNSFRGQYFNVAKNGGMSSELPIAADGFLSYSKDGSKFAYNQKFRAFRTWKYYKGGMAPEVWIYDKKTKISENITNNISQDICPMWYNDDIYFISDRDRTMNLFVYNTKTKDTKKLTNFTKYDIKFPTIGKDKIVFEKGGYIFIFDIKTQETKKIVIEINNDFVSSRDKIVTANKHITSATLSPSGKRIALSGRGDIFSIPVKSGITRNLTQTSGVHERSVTWSPNGKYIAYLSDKSGEYEIYITKEDGTEDAIQITKNGDTYKYTIKWSPDSKKIMWNDKMNRLSYVDIDTKKIAEIEKSERGQITSFNWSPDSKWVTYSKKTGNNFKIVMLYKLDNKDKFPVTENWYSSTSSSFSNDGKFLYFTSDRDFTPIYSNVEWNIAYKDMTKIYFIALSKDTDSPFKLKNDEVIILDDKEKANKKEKKDAKEEKKDIKIDKEGIVSRIGVLPLKAANYYHISVLENKVYYIKKSLGGGYALYLYNLKSKKEIKVGKYYGYNISTDKKKMLLSYSKYYLVDLPKGEVKPKKSIDLSNMKVKVNLHEEWEQIYNESWRQMRDFFYDPNMHGVDWAEMKKKYAVLLPYVNNRKDLTYIIGELIGELNIGHAYTGGGDIEKPKRIKTGLLGAKISKDKSGYFKIDKILNGHNWDKKLRSPLTEINSNISEGDYIISVNGQETKEMTNIYSALVGKANIQVELGISSSANNSNVHKEIVKPIADESKLYYYNWVQDNINKVSKATNGEVGYIHVPDMSARGLSEFVKYFYPQLNKKALIIDDRGNGGGNVSPMIIERLRREVAVRGMTRNNSFSTTKPRQLMEGPQILLINAFSASDGDLFPYEFRDSKLGKIIGTRSWGGVVGINGSLSFIDGGTLTKPEHAHFSADGSKWIIEGHGVDPDIVIENDPAQEYQGIDQQLNKAIELIKLDLKEHPVVVPPIPAFPNKSK